MRLISFGDALRHRPGGASDTARALLYPDGELSWDDLDRRASRRARLFASLGVGKDDLVAVALPNSILYHETIFAIWKCGATPCVVSAKLPAHEFDQIVALAKPALIVGRRSASANCPHSDADVDLTGFDDTVFDAPIAASWKAMTSGGSTGRPKIIVDRTPAGRDLDEQMDWPATLRMEPGMVILNPGPLYHNAPFMTSHLGLITGCPVIGMANFDAEEALRLIECHRVNWVNLVPTMMHRIWALPPEIRDRYDLSSLRIVWHMAAPCPRWLKRAWIDWLGAETIHEYYGGAEGIGGTTIRGDEWIDKPGSVGRPSGSTVIRVVGEDGGPCAPNEAGEIYFQTQGAGALPYVYIGAEPSVLDDGWQSLGDIGHLDEDGYLFLADRRVDLILRGGVNIYPAEVEAALDAHPDIASSVVVSVPCDELGHRVHAIVEPRAGAVPDIDVLHAFLLERLAKNKIPESYETADLPLRDDAGKVRRSAMRDERARWIAEGRVFRHTPGSGA